MPRYVDWADIVGRYPTAARIAGQTGVGSYWLEHAEAEVDGRLAPYFAVPFANTPAPHLVRDLAIDLTYYKMTIQQPGSEKIWKYIESRFKAIENGTLIVTTSAGIMGGGEDSWTSHPYHSSFGPDAPENWEVSSQSIQDALAERGQI